MKKTLAHQIDTTSALTARPLHNRSAMPSAAGAHSIHTPHMVGYYITRSDPSSLIAHMPRVANGQLFLFQFHLSERNE